jgi:hypothetical protein
MVAEVESFGGGWKLEALAWPAIFTDVAVMRRPRGVDEGDCLDLAKRLAREGFLVVGLARSNEESWHPTDRFREIGGMIWNNGKDGEWEATVDFLGGIRPEQDVVDVATSLMGGFYVHLDSHQLLVGSFPGEDWSFERVKGRDEALDGLRQTGWEVVELPYQPVMLSRVRAGWGKMRAFEMDFDGLVSLFAGNDGQPHAVVAQAVAERVREAVSDKVVVHPIPDLEAGLGHGCNVADLRQGQVLVPPNRGDAPTTMMILRRFAQAKIVEAPPGFFDSTSGPRCNLCSFARIML